jgi:molybdopterin synthase sulfur carrier subunit
MRIRLRFFASVREALGHAHEDYDTRAGTLAGVRDELIARGGAYAATLARGKSLRVALDQVMSEESAEIREGCEVAFFPPVTGG